MTMYDSDDKSWGRHIAEFLAGSALWVFTIAAIGVVVGILGPLPLGWAFVATGLIVYFLLR